MSNPEPQRLFSIPEVSKLWPLGQRPATRFCITIYTFKWLEKKSKEKEHNVTHENYEIQISVSVSKVLLEHSHTYLYVAAVATSML